MGKSSCRTAFTEVQPYSECDEDRSPEAVFQVRTALEPGGKSHHARGYDLCKARISDKVMGSLFCTR